MRAAPAVMRGAPATSAVSGADAHDSRLVMRVTAILRVLLVPMLFFDDNLATHFSGSSVYFNIILAVATVYSLLMLAAAWSPAKAPLSPGMTLSLDLIFISGLAFCAGTGFRQVRAAFLIAPVVGALRLSPRRTAAMTIFAGAAYVVVALTHPVQQPRPAAAVLVHGTFILWTGTLAVVLAHLRERRQRRIRELAEARGRLVGQVIETEERARKQISGTLHDHVIQDLLSARQDLEEVRNGRNEALGRVEGAVDEALQRLRGVIEDLDPYVLDQLDLTAAIRGLAEREARHGRHRVEIDIDRAACGVADGLIASVAGELLRNAAKHAQASLIELDLRRQDGQVVLEVLDNGRGFTRAQALAALSEGHIGLAGTEERIEAVGGIFTIDSSPGSGTRVRCIIPAARGEVDPTDADESENPWLPEAARHLVMASR